MKKPKSPIQSFQTLIDTCFCARPFSQPWEFYMSSPFANEEMQVEERWWKNSGIEKDLSIFSSIALYAGHGRNQSPCGSRWCKRVEGLATPVLKVKVRQLTYEFPVPDPRRSQPDSSAQASTGLNGSCFAFPITGQSHL